MSARLSQDDVELATEKGQHRHPERTSKVPLSRA